MTATATKMPPAPPAVMRLIERESMPTSEQVQARYRIIAGPYRRGDEKMLKNCLDSLQGCRVVVAKGKHGLEVFRLRTECVDLQDEPENDEPED